MPPQEDIILETISKAREGDQKAFSQLMDRFWPEVYGFQLRRTQNENDAEDISIQTFARAFDKLDSYDPKFGFNTWLITISKNLHVDLLRKRKRNVLEQRENHSGDAMKKVLDESPSAEDQLIIDQNLKTLLENIKKLKPAYRRVIELRYFREMSYAEIAEDLNEPLGNVKIKLLRAKKLLATAISQRQRNG
ncbi:RNA polymerase sigma factor [Robiginitalea aurantiaca]|uniref:Sigma-70 family RNA polymerase sigma factor n=1 Tax=Robiginitalea aurantiaca TaxID=3056915 RepID=A0ABT7WHE2_9FLAO|nr:sigma-70 family RNA polymerase sigma factor [Robiginitalea aurantiaca]MDM9632342.1 sigma-70 family RNA polymerase sigma factor [Robiginitalea aurantiaca]